MEERKISRLELYRIPKTTTILKPNKVFAKGNDVLKIYNFHPTRQERNTTYFDYNLYDSLDIEQIEILSKMRDIIKGTKMVRGIITCSKVPIGVIYDYFMNYKDFSYLSTEETSLMFNNLKSLIEKINELTSYDIYHTDIHPGNILYQGTDVELIDIDGKYVSFEECKESKVYKELYETIMDIITKKLLSQYSKENVSLIRNEIYKIFNRSKCLMGITYKDIEHIEDLKLIK